MAIELVEARHPVIIITYTRYQRRETIEQSSFDLEMNQPNSSRREEKPKNYYTCKQEEATKHR